MRIKIPRFQRTLLPQLSLLPEYLGSRFLQNVKTFYQSPRGQVPNDSNTFAKRLSTAVRDHILDCPMPSHHHYHYSPLCASTTRRTFHTCLSVATSRHIWVPSFLKSPTTSSSHRSLGFPNLLISSRLESMILLCIIIIIICPWEPGYLSRYSDSLRAGRSGDRIPVGARFFAPVQTGPGTHPASYAMSTWSFPGVKRPGRGVDHPPPIAPRLRKE
jgi:hypothetical protein